MANNKKSLKQQIAALLKNAGYTQYEVDSRKAALEFLYVSFYFFGIVGKKSKQLKYLINPDTMSDEEWILYLDISWKDEGIVFDDYIN
ncbi:MAG: hypothetical protein CL398_09385 [Acidiferrobacteraceae bacterium]|nr:hypothetical protein [Acidiferrobacteraceae bacterium]|tara:strand:+ start:322 stop:585 length:264 start_codon:yes stop_codon:yes gene_type:complete